VKARIASSRRLVKNRPPEFISRVISLFQIRPNYSNIALEFGVIITRLKALLFSSLSDDVSFPYIPFSVGRSRVA